jgi:predicted kinase
MRGLPGSGKSTWAKALVAEETNVWKRINRDELRLMFDDGRTSDGNEKFVKKVRDILIIKALEEGKNVIVDDLNLSSKNEIRIKQLVGEYSKSSGSQVTVEVKEMDTPIEECLARDAKRAKPVGARVIKDLYRQFYFKGATYIQDPRLPRAIICDLDGTLAIIGARSPYDAANCELDILNTAVASTLKNYKILGYTIILCSGRKEADRAPSQRWLASHNIHFDTLFMRADDDNRKDSIVKKEIFETSIAGKFYIEFCLDDRDQVVDMWRNELGLNCYQVNYGDF